jgi:glutamate-1-semialdehyde 2,1-aminomutase
VSAKAKSTALPASPPRAGSLSASGSQVWASDGQAYTDFDLAGGAVILGHAHPEVDHAYHNPSPEALTLVKERLLRLQPFAQAVRVAKTGQDALRAAFEAARAVTGRSRIVIWESRPMTLAELTDVAAIVVAPLGMDAGQFGAAERLASAFGAILIFDETESGFRVHEQAGFGLTGIAPDLAVFGSGIANGHPVGAVTGSRELISLLPLDTPLPDHHCLSAAAATLDILLTTPPAPGILAMGARLMAEIGARIRTAEAQTILGLGGHPSLPTTIFHSPQAEGLWLGEIARKKLILFGPHALSPAHDQADFDTLLSAYDHILELLTSTLMSGSGSRSWVRSFGDQA